MLNHLSPEKINVKDGKKKGLSDSVRPPFSSQNLKNLSTTISNYGTPNKDCGFSPSQESFGGSSVKAYFSGGEKLRLKKPSAFLPNTPIMEN